MTYKEMLATFSGKYPLFCSWVRGTIKDSVDRQKEAMKKDYEGAISEEEASDICNRCPLSDVTTKDGKASCDFCRLHNSDRRRYWSLSDYKQLIKTGDWEEDMKSRGRSIGLHYKDGIFDAPEISSAIARLGILTQLNYLIGLCLLYEDSRTNGR